MNIIYQICEITATMIETTILLEFINKLLGSKLYGLKNILQLVLAFAIINSYMIVIGFISVEYSAVLDLIGILLYEIYAVIFMKKNLIYRCITPILSIMTIFLLNIIISIIASYIFKSEPNELLIDRNLLRISMLFITKFSFFILTRVILKIAKPKEVLLNKQELTAISLIFIISIVIIGFSGEIYYSSSRNSTIDEFLIIRNYSVPLKISQSRERNKGTEKTLLCQFTSNDKCAILKKKRW